MGGGWPPGVPPLDPPFYFFPELKEINWTSSCTISIMKTMARFGSSAIPASLIRGALRKGGGGGGGGHFLGYQSVRSLRGKREERVPWPKKT